MKLSTKCSFNLRQLEISLSKGLPYIEFHTNYSDFDDTIDFTQIRKILDENDVTCLTVHSPISDENNSFSSISIGTLYKESRKKNIELYKKCIKVANILCGTSTPTVVAHIGTCFDVYDYSKNALTSEDISIILEEAANDLKEINNYIDTFYPGTVFVVENMPHFSYDRNGSLYGWYFGKGHDLPKFLESLNLRNIKSCLDICHLQMTLLVENLCNPSIKQNIEDYIQSYSKTLGLIHLNNTVKLGELTKYHSQPFLANKKEDVEFLIKFFKAIIKNNITCPITLEINEDDYYVQNNVSLTIEAILEANKTLNLNSISNTLCKRNIIKVSN